MANRVPPIGLDIGSVSIRAVEVSHSKDTTVINNFGRVPLPEGAMVGGVVKDPASVTAALRKMWSSQRFGTKSVILGVTHQQVIVREVEIPRIPAKELRRALPFQVRDVLPLPPEQAILDFYPLDNDDDDSEKETQRGLLVAAPKDVVTDLVTAVEKAGLRVVQVDLSCFAALRAAAHPTPDTEAIIDIGANGTNVLIHTDGVPHIARMIPRGGADITRMLMTRLELNLADAERVKSETGVIGDSDAAKVIRDAVKPLISEVRSSVSYYTSAGHHRSVARLALVGGASDLPGLDEQFTAAMRIPSFVANPLQHVSDSRHGGRHDVLGIHRASAAVCVGLTLGAA